MGIPTNECDHCHKHHTAKMRQNKKKKQKSTHNSAADVFEQEAINMDGEVHTLNKLDN